MSARVQHRTFNLNGNVQQLQLTGIPTASLRQISIQADPANAAVVYLGGEGVNDVSNTDFGVIIPIPVSTVPAAPFVLEFEDGGIELGDYYVKGANGEKLHLLIMRYI